MLARRLVLWKDGDFDKLLNEARALQDRLNQHRNQMSIESISQTFAKHMMKGNIQAALRLLDDAPRAGVIDINDATLNELKRMHPSSKDINEQVMLTGELPKVQSSLSR